MLDSRFDQISDPAAEEIMAPLRAQLTEDGYSVANQEPGLFLILVPRHLFPVHQPWMNEACLSIVLKDDKITIYTEPSLSPDELEEWTGDLAAPNFLDDFYAVCDKWYKRLIELSEQYTEYRNKRNQSFAECEL